MATSLPATAYSDTDGLGPAGLDRLLPLLDILNCGAAILNRAGIVIHANARLCSLLERPTDQIIGTDISTWYADPAARAQIQRILTDFDRPHEGEFYLPARGGGRIPVVTSARRIAATGPLGEYRLVTLIDISPQKAAEEGLKEQYRTVAELSNTILDQAMTLKHYADALELRVRQRTAELHEANLDAIYMLAIASEAKDQDTGAHVRRIETYARLLAREMGLTQKDADEIGYSAILHDVGKIHVPDDILKKPGALTPDERTICNQHTLHGERILSTKPFFAPARRIARSHHENFDGSGYPDALSGYAIPIEARIVHLADVYDALTSVRVYKSAWSPTDAASVIRESSGAMFDPDIVRAFESLFNSARFDAPAP